jgi:hypothetical protein
MLKIILPKFVLPTKATTAMAVAVCFDITSSVLHCLGS